MSDDLAGLGRILAFDLRRSWLRMLIWALVLAVLVLATVAYQAQTFPTQADRDAYAGIANTPAVAALTGLPYAAATAGGILNIKLWMTGAVALALISIFLVTRNGRAEEETGRAELLRSGRLGRHAMSLASWLIAAGFALVGGLVSGLAGIAAGLPPEGSLLMGLSWTGCAWAFIGIAAVTGQLCSTGRGATAWAAVVLAAAYLVRAIADVNGTGEQPSWLTWLSPIGWAQQTRSFGEERWWALLPLLALGLAAAGVALALERTRDLGAGRIPARSGPAHAAAITRSVLGLPVRLQRVPLIAWAAGIAVAAVFFGTVGKLMNDLVAQLGSSPIGAALTAGAGSAVDGVLGYLVLVVAVLVSGFAVQSALVLRSDEAAGRAAWEWTAAVSRIGWTGARLAIPAIAALLLLALGGALLGATYGATIGDPGQTGRFVLAAIAYWPAVLLLIAVVGVLVAVLPRASIAIAWSVYGVLVLLAVLGDVLGLPSGVVDATPYWATPRLGAVDPSWGGVWAMAIAAIVLAFLALWRMRARDEVEA